MLFSRRAHASLGVFIGVTLGLAISAAFDVLTEAKRDDRKAQQETDELASLAYSCTCDPNPEC